MEDDGGEVPVGGGEVAEEEEGEEDEAEEGEEESTHGGDRMVGQEAEKNPTEEVAQGESKKAAGGDKKGFLPSSPIGDLVSSLWHYQVGQDGEARDSGGEDEEDDQQLGLDRSHNFHQAPFLASEQGTG